jgi:hypothetical protein
MVTQKHQEYQQGEISYCIDTATQLLAAAAAGRQLARPLIPAAAAWMCGQAAPGTLPAIKNEGPT